MRILIFLIFVSCANFSNRDLPKDIVKASAKVCLSSSGNGRLTVLGKKYVFSYESLLDNEMAKWILAMSFPLRNPETFELDWSRKGKIKFTSSIEEKVLKENRNINPASLDRFTQNLGKFFEEIVLIKSGKSIEKPVYSWEVKGKKIFSNHKDKSINAKFDNLTGEDYFGLMSVKYHDTDGQSFDLDLVVRHCLKK